MDDSITIATGKTILFYAALGRNGITVYVQKRQFNTLIEKQTFEKELRSERDVVAIIYK